ncbi:succinyldiaminopimelate transaminase [Nocardioides rubriscoriae]|uniref:succinyldiaminopimelate transaminase n=1 Tax=Nocardioides rubriscoriae TaxID=642762 RepID=UPI0011DF77C1|nr:succinyldiaminopimelate transaminase [Nocardioides rubriscoriae]
MRPGWHAGVAATRQRAAACGLPVVDLSVGAPVDPTPEVVRRALVEHADSPGYPLTIGRPGLREAHVDWLARVHGVTGLAPEQTLPTVGSKELIGTLPLLVLDAARPGPVAIPALAYPTYAVGAALAGREVVSYEGVDDLRALPVAPALVWVNSPANPTGRVLAPADLAALVAWGREHGALVVSDECYLDLGWGVDVATVLHHDVNAGSTEGLLAVHSLSKRSNLAGYRCGFVAGDAAVVADLTAHRRDLGLIMPEPQQAAAIAALGDETHVAEQRARYAARRAVLRAALVEGGFRIDHSEAGLYLWATRGEPSHVTTGWLADRGVVSVDGLSYGPTGDEHVRLAITATDEAVALAADRLTAIGPGSGTERMAP